MGCCGARRPSRRRARGRSKLIATKQQPILEAQSISRHRIVMCPPDHYGINYSINPWMKIENGVDQVLAITQWNALHSKLHELGVEVLLVEPQPGLPDMVFTANAGLISGNDFVLSKFKFPERTGEEIIFEQFFHNLGFNIRHISSAFEGAGDALYLGHRLIGGFGFRSTVEAYAEITGWSAIVNLVDSRFYHLDTCFCPLQDGKYMIFPGAFEESGLATIRSLGKTEIEVSQDEAVKFACNAVVIGMDVVLPSGCPVTCNKLESQGYRTHPIEMSEFIKSGGACKCLTLSL